MDNKGIANAFQLKCVMAVFMLLDHLHHYLPGMPDWFTWLGRLVAPVFCFLMTQGMRHTSDRRRYINRMLIAGTVMFAGNMVLTVLFDSSLTQNIFWSLGVSGAILYYMDRILAKEGEVYGNLLVMVVLFLVGATVCEGLLLLPVMALIFYYLYNRPVLMYLAYVAAMTVLVNLYFRNMFPQILMAWAIIPIAMYNGKRGRNTPLARNFFYVFYPVHVWVLFVAGYFLKS